jgi:CheY-like chemotaxis protein/MinD-like ATPase involved in chromosome partitioning or flagellar assembly
LHILHIDPDEASSAYVRRALEGLGHRTTLRTTAEAGLQVARSQQPDVVILELDLPDLDGVEAIRQIRTDPRTQGAVVVVLSARAEGELGAAQAAGAAVALHKQPAALEHLLRAIESLPGAAAETTPSRRAAAMNHLVVFLSANGGSGTSTLCANLAHEIARFQPDRTVGVADLVLPIGSLAEITGVNSDINLVAMARRPNEDYTPEALRRLLPRAEGWGFHLLPGCSDPGLAPSIPTDRFGKLVDSMRGAFDVTVVDIGKNLSRLSLRVLTEATLNVVILIPEVARLSASRSLLSYLAAEEMPAGKFFVLSNRPLSALGIAGEPLEVALGRPADAGIPHLGVRLEGSNQQHLPLTVANPEDPGSTHFHDVAVQIIARLRQGR